MTGATTWPSGATGRSGPMMWLRQLWGQGHTRLRDVMVSGSIGLVREPRRHRGIDHNDGYGREVV